MAIEIVYTLDCPHCSDESGTAVMRTLAVDQPEEDGTVVIDVELSIGQSEFRCRRCGCSVYIGDLLYEAETEDCPAEEDEDDGDEALVGADAAGEGAP